MEPRLQLVADPHAMAAAAGSFLADTVRAALAAKGTCAIGLSGGKTPRAAYTALGEAEGIDWTRVTVFLVDERLVPDTDERSNARLAQETLLAGAGAHAAFVAPDVTLSPEACADEYDARLRTILANGIDVVVLGLGEDGHIASLFPPVTAAATGDRYAIHTTTSRFEVFDRVGTTLTALERARNVLFLLQGAGKKKTWGEMTASADGWERWPAKRVLERCETTVIAQW